MTQFEITEVFVIVDNMGYCINDKVYTDLELAESECAKIGRQSEVLNIADFVSNARDEAAANAHWDYH